MPGRRSVWRLLLLAVPAVVGLVVLLYFFMQSYVLDQVEKRVRDTMLECRAFHQYVQQDMHPAYYELMAEGALPEGFYAPELLSSSYIARSFQRHFNEVRRDEGLPEVIYKIAAVDPRNAVNEATPKEAELIAWFNEDRTRTEFSDIVEEDGERYLLYAKPFLEVKPGCLKCHGRPEDAPAQLRAKYDWDGAWNLEAGQIVAAEFIRSPLHGEFNVAGGAFVVAVAVLAGLLVLLVFNNRLGALVTRRTRDLEEGRQRFANVIEGVGAGTWDLDLATRSMVVNERWAEMLGYGLDEVTPTGLDTLSDLSHPDDRTVFLQEFEGYLEGGGQGSFEARYRARHRDGRWVWIYSRGRVLEWDQDQRPLRMCGTNTDITDDMRLREEKARIEAEYHQAQKVESVGRLAGGVAHDLNNLLTPVIGYSELLLADTDSQDESQEAATEIHAAGIRARDLVRQLLAFSRKQTLEFAPVNLNDVLVGFKKLLGHTVRENVSIELELADDLEPIMADVGQLEQIVMNLVVNAADAMPDGGRLVLRTNLEGGEELDAVPESGAIPGPHVRFTVTDSGQGMTPEVLEKIFEPFFTTKKELGTGLGLATVYGIVKQHGGNIAVTSEPGRGTTFQLDFPVASNTEVITGAAGEVAVSCQGGTESILLVEDDEQVVRLTALVLRRHGYRITVCGDGDEAMRCLDAADGPFDLLLTDVILPGRDGKALYADARQKQPGLRVLYMSGYPADVIAHHGVLERDTQLIQKPFSSRDLLGKVRSVLGTAMRA